MPELEDELKTIKMIKILTEFMTVWKLIFLLCPVQVHMQVQVQVQVICKCIQHMQKARDTLPQRNKNVNKRDPSVILTFCSSVDCFEH